MSCGRPVPGQQVSIVDPVRPRPVAEGAEGEIWIAGPHVTAGPPNAAADEWFGELDGTRFLRTGDLGHLRDGELHVTGRMKDVIVVRGVNYHAIDVEAAAVEFLGLASGTAAAFSVQTPSGSAPVLVVEVRGKRDRELAVRVRTAVLATTYLRLATVTLVAPNSIPRTSSGKVRRSACRDAFVAGRLTGPTADGRAAADAAVGTSGETDAGTVLVDLVCGVIAGVADADDVRPSDRVADLSVDSVRAAEAAAVLEDAIGLPVPLTTILGTATPQEIGDALLAHWSTDGHPVAMVRHRLMTATEVP